MKKMKLYVGNLGDDGNITSTDLRPLFETYGTVTECECIKNYAFVHMEEESAATEAVTNLNGHSVKGRPIKVEKSESKGPRKPSQKLFIGNIAEGTTNEELKAVFESFAGVLEADVIKNYGFVHIDANAGRQKVNEIIRELNGYNLNGNSIRVQMSTSGVRQRPGMGGDQCYRCGREGHWSKECPQYPDYPPSGFGGRGGRGGPMRGAPPYGNRGGPGGYSRDPYPPPPPPSYMRERMDGYGYGGYGGYGGGMEPRGRDPYGRGGDPMYDRRPPYPGAGGREMGGPGPMRGPDPYAARDPYATNGSYASDAGYSQPAFSTGAGAAYSTGYGAAAGAGGDMYSRRSPGPPRGGAANGGGYGPPARGPPGGYSGGAPAAPVGGSSGPYSGGYGAY